ncbi:46089_t:CDS:2, partial [Gigaspora margarita]
SSSRTQVSGSVTDNFFYIIIPLIVHPVEKIRNNASAQKKSAKLKEIAEKNIKELENIYNITTDSQLRKDLFTRISDLEYGSADKRRRKEAIKVRIVNHLPKAYHHPAWISVTGVSCDKTKEHPNEHYCLASIKEARQFAQTFSDISIIISQDNKSKIGLGISVVGTSSITYAEDLFSLVSDEQYSGILKINNNIKPIWILLVNGGPDENPRHFKNIQSYCKLFRKFNVDYLTICMHAPKQFKYNPIERGMFTLSGKLARIILPINHFGNHFDSQGKTIDTELATQNFCHAGTILCDIWCHDPIFGKYMNATYVDEATNPFINL